MTTTLEIVASSNETVYGNSLVSYAVARSTASDILAYPVVGQVEVSPDYNQWSVYRGFLKFDTSVIPADATITKVALRMVCSAERVTHYSIALQIIEHDWSAIDPISAGNMEAVYDACLAASDFFVWVADMNAVLINTQYTGADMTIGYVNRTGNTYYSLRSSQDKDGTVPLKAQDYLIFNHADKPTLIVEYTAPPTITGISTITGLSSIQF